MSDRDKNPVLRPTATVHSSLTTTSNDSGEPATFKSYKSQEQASLTRHGEHNSGYHIEMKQFWYLQNGHKTWGWPVYRTCYEDDERWDLFKLKFRALLLEPMRRSRHFTAEEVKERSQFIDFPFWEDRARFEGVSTLQLREHYLTYLNTDAPFSEQGLPILTGSSRQQFFDRWLCRYNFFLVADAAAIASVVDGPEDPPPYLIDETPWINVVQVKWSLEEELDVGEGEDPDDGYEIMEGTDLWNVGFHRHALQTLYPGLWNVIGQFFVDDWYERPPAVKWEFA